jgi:hypothetical protein
MKIKATAVPRKTKTNWKAHNWRSMPSLSYIRALGRYPDRLR